MDDNIKFIVISYPEMFAHEITLVNQLFEAGLQYFHLRKPDADRTQQEQFIQAIHSAYRDRIVVHQHFDLVEKYGLKGIHITKNTNNYTKEKPVHMHKSISTHSVNELFALDASYDYAFLSPVFDSISKAGYKSNFDTEMLKHLFQTYSLPVMPVALGGITPDNIAVAKDIGFKGIAVLGYLWNSYFESGNAEALIEVFHKIKEQCKEVSMLK